jgi:hypothetical protein
MTSIRLNNSNLLQVASGFAVLYAVIFIAMINHIGNDGGNEQLQSFAGCIRFCRALCPDFCRMSSLVVRAKPFNKREVLP